MTLLPEIQEIVKSNIEKISWSSTLARGLYDPIDYVMSLGGKRIRPSLLLMSADAFGANPRDFVNQALAIEVFHNFTLLHDDVMDNAPVRRGKPTVHVKWSESTAILSGDAMLIKAYELLADGIPDDKLPSVLALFLILTLSFTLTVPDAVWAASGSASCSCVVSADASTVSSETTSR